RNLYGQVRFEGQKVDFSGGSHVIFRDSNYKIIRVGGPGTDLDQAIKTACEYANETFWCTEDPKTAKIYLERGPLYLIFERGNENPVAQTDGDQLMNRNDEEIEFPDNPRLYEILAEVGVISKASYFLKYAYYVVGGRWIPGEKYILQDQKARLEYLDLI